MNYKEKLICNKEYCNTFYNRLNELYNYLVTNNKFPNNSKENIFSDGTKMHWWLIDNIYILMGLSEENEKAKYIVTKYEETKRERKEDLRKNFELKINEVYQYYLKTGALPHRNSDVVFSDGTKMSNWLKNNMYKLKQIEEDDEKAKTIVGLNNKDDIIPKEKNMDERISWLYDYINSNNINKLDKNEIFEDGTNINNWLSKNISRLNELYALNPKVIYILIIYMNSIKENNVTLEKNMTEKIVEMYIYISTNKSIPDSNSNICFSDGTNMRNWLDINQENLNSMRDNNYYINAISFAYTSKKNSGNLRKMYQIRFQNRINETYEICQKNGMKYIIRYKISFSNGTEIYPWIKRNYNLINKQAKENYKAQTIINELEKTDILNMMQSRSSKINNFRLSLKFNRKIIEVCNYCITKHSIPGRTKKNKLHNGANMEEWLCRNKRKILESRFRNPYCLKLVKELLEINPSFYKCLESNNNTLDDNHIGKRYRLLIR